MVTHVVTLANSIVGVSVLAMPFCFKFCGIFLATFMLILGAIMTRIVCYFLLKAGTMTKRRTYELLAYHTFGHGGKFMVEITIIGFLVGTLIAFLVVIGDLGPQIVAEIFSIENNDSLRTVVMTGLALLVALPLGLLRDIDSLGSVSTVSFLFYLFLVLKILNEGVGVLGSERMEHVNYWRPSGVLQCIPIFSMALSCQTQIFSIYDSLPEPSLHKMNEVVRKAVYLCTAFYFCVGFFGYIAFSAEGLTGNILMSFGSTWTTQLIKVCFVLSIAFSVPLCVFPCRASLHSLIYKGVHTHHSVHDISTNYIPDGKLRFLTILIIGVTLIIALLIPNIELVLGLVGSTAGSIICLIFPSAMFIRVTSKHTTERLLAQFVLAIGICIMFLTTYVTLYAVEQAKVNPPEPNIIATELILDSPKLIEKNPQPPHLIHNEEDIVKFEPKIPLVKDSLPDQVKSNGEDKAESQVLPELKPNLLKLSSSTPSAALPIIKSEERDKPISSIEPIDSKRESEKYALPLKEEEVMRKEESPLKKEESPVLVPVEVKPESSIHESIAKEPELQPVEDKKEEKKVEEKSKEFAPKEFLKKLEEHQEEQKKLIEEQKEILAELKQHHEKDNQRDKLHDESEKLHAEETAKVLNNMENTAQAGEKNIQGIDELKKGLEEEVKKIESQPKQSSSVPSPVEGSLPKHEDLQSESDHHHKSEVEVKPNEEVIENKVEPVVPVPVPGNDVNLPSSNSNIPIKNEAKREVKDEENKANEVNQNLNAKPIVEADRDRDRDRDRDM